MSGENFNSSNEGNEIIAVVKWFNSFKGFGFVTAVDKNTDAFLHISTLNRAGLHDLTEGTEMLCEVIPGDRGIQVSKIIKITQEIKPAYPTPPALADDEQKVEGTVKWFKPNKGFGFAVPTDGSEDIFLHKAVLRLCEVHNLYPNQRIVMHVKKASRGKEATWVIPH